MGLRSDRLARDGRLFAPLLVDLERALFDRRRETACGVCRAARPRAELFFGVNFELSFNADYWEPTRNSGEIRPIIGIRFGPVDLIANPILDTSFQGLGALDFAPAARVAYNFSESWAVAFEHYTDYGQLSHFEPLARQQQTLFAVVDYKADPMSVEFGIGHGFTTASDALVLKMILSYDF